MLITSTIRFSIDFDEMLPIFLIDLTLTSNKETGSKVFVFSSKSHLIFSIC